MISLFPAPSGDGGGFTAGPMTTVAVPTVLDATSDPSLYDAASFQPDADHVTLLHVTVDVDLGWAAGETPIVPVQALAVPALPVADNLGSVVQTPGATASAGTAGSAGTATIPLSFAFIVPAGWHVMLTYTPPDSGTAGLTPVAYKHTLN